MSNSNDHRTAARVVTAALRRHGAEGTLGQSIPPAPRGPAGLRRGLPVALEAKMAGPGSRVLCLADAE